jgi:hypothetical protein
MVPTNSPAGLEISAKTAAIMGVQGSFDDSRMNNMNKFYIACLVVIMLLIVFSL